MLFIRTDDLKPGMRLAKPIYNKLGVMLYDRDTRLTRQGIESIRNFELSLPNRFRHYPTRILLSNSSRPFPCSSFETAWI